MIINRPQDILSCYIHASVKLLEEWAFIYRLGIDYIVLERDAPYTHIAEFLNPEIAADALDRLPITPKSTLTHEQMSWTPYDKIYFDHGLGDGEILYLDLKNNTLGDTISKWIDDNNIAYQSAIFGKRFLRIVVEPEDAILLRLMFSEFDFSIYEQYQDGIKRIVTE